MISPLELGMKYINLFFLTSIVVMLTACSGHKITPKYVYPDRYDRYSCEQLNTEKDKLVFKLNKLSEAQKIENSDNSAGTSRDYNYTITNQISESHGEYNAILKTLEKKKCKVN